MFSVSLDCLHMRHLTLFILSCHSFAYDSCLFFSLKESMLSDLVLIPQNSENLETVGLLRLNLSF